MKYINFEIENFKGINKLNIDLTKLPFANVFTLVGLNESGKTPILEAVNLFQNPVRKERAHEMIHKSKKGIFDGEISISATLELNEEDEERIKIYCEKEIFFLLIKCVGNIKVTKKYKFKDSRCEDGNRGSWNISLIGSKKRSKKEVDLFTADKESWKKVVAYIESNFFPKIIYYENFLFDFPERIYLEEHEDEGREQEAYRKVLQDILSSINKKLDLGKHVLERLKSDKREDKESLESTLGDMSQKLTTAIFSSWGELLGKSNKEIETPNQS